MKKDGLTEQTPRVHVGREEVAFAGQGSLGRQARHISRLHDVFEVVARVTTSNREVSGV